MYKPLNILQTSFWSQYKYSTGSRNQNCKFVWSLVHEKIAWKSKTRVAFSSFLLPFQMNFGKVAATLNCQFKIFMTMFPRNNLKHTKLMFQVEKWQEISGKNFTKDFSSYLFFTECSIKNWSIETIRRLFQWTPLAFMKWVPRIP